jgi:hypothetical protein
MTIAYSTPIVAAASAAPNEASTSAVSWAAVVAGAFVSAAFGLILLALGAGAGLSSLSPWANAGASPQSVGVGALAWLAIVEVAASAAGGYLAGRLRTKWVNVHSHEVYFRDTAHGLLTWAVALVITVGFLTSAASVMVGGDNGSAASSRSGVSTDPNRYYIDHLFRSVRAPGGVDTGVEPIRDPEVRSEVSAIFVYALAARALTPDDRSQIGGLVAKATGLNRAEAEGRVGTVFTQAQAALDVARKATAHALYWLFVALLSGAFVASVAATFGGGQRDRVPAHSLSGTGSPEFSHK